jgi:hypothetical protein
VAAAVDRQAAVDTPEEAAAMQPLDEDQAELARPEMLPAALRSSCKRDYRQIERFHKHYKNWPFPATSETRL